MCGGSDKEAMCQGREGERERERGRREEGEEEEEEEEEESLFKADAVNEEDPERGEDDPERRN